MNREMWKIKSIFEKLFDKKPVLVRSPGRVNLIGEHTDYNEGFVLPAAIDKSIYFAIHPAENNKIRLYAADLDESCECKINDIQRSDKSWANYLIGVVDQISKAGKNVKGFDCVFGGNIPIGAGLSSSAAIEAGLAFALNVIFELGIDNIDLVKLSQKAENEFVGVQCGIMDQFINIFGQEKKVLKLDCRSLDYEYYPFENENLKIVLCDTRVKHSLAGSEYNLRRNQCEKGAAILREFDPSIKSLRDVNLNLLNEYRSLLDPVIFRRCEYVVKENRRVDSACKDLNKNDFSNFGRLMYLSHEGLKKDYEVSCMELDLLVDIASQIDGVLGARMMGGGFGGCTINIVSNDRIEDFKRIISTKYKNKYSIEPMLYISEIRGGTYIIHE